MIDFQQLKGPSGIPVYFQQLPVRSVSVYWLVFVGSADDELVGNHGVYHWFEHIPSRGTRKFPGGYQDTEARLVRHGGEAGAETDYTHTAYYADVPRRVWTTALDILTDMIAQPLLRAEDIEAEREIIKQEIDEWHSSPYGESLCRLPALLWPGHPLGHDQLGSPETLQSMDQSTLRRAHQQGYARSRCVLFVAGDLERNAVLDAVGDAVRTLSDAQLPTRRTPTNYGLLPDWSGGTQTVYDTRHEDSSVYLLFPLPARQTTQDLVLWTVVEYLITAGDLGSPLNRLVREHSQLAYSPSFMSSISPAGGYWGLEAQTNCVELQRVVEQFWRVLQSEELRSAERFEYVHDTIRGEFDMHDPSPGEFTEEAAQRLTGYYTVWSDGELKDRLLSVSRDELVAFLEQLQPTLARTVLFRGGRARAVTA